MNGIARALYRASNLTLWASLFGLVAVGLLFLAFGDPPHMSDLRSVPPPRIGSAKIIARSVTQSGDEKTLHLTYQFVLDSTNDRRVTQSSERYTGTAEKITVNASDPERNRRFERLVSHYPKGVWVPLYGYKVLDQFNRLDVVSSRLMSPCVLDHSHDQGCAQTVLRYWSVRLFLPGVLIFVSLFLWASAWSIEWFSPRPLRSPRQ